MATVAVSLAVLSDKTVPTCSRLFGNACCPSLDLVALCRCAPPSLSLSRTTGQADDVCEYTVGKAATKGKPVAAQPQQPQQPQGEIACMAWDPHAARGLLAVAHAATSATAAALVLVSVQTGQAVLEVPLPSSAPLSSLAWHPLPLPHAPLSSSSFSAQLVAKLPTLPALQDPSPKPALGPGGPGPGPGLGVFGSAKNAMLQREREKEQGRPVHIKTAAPHFPTFVGDGRVDDLSLLVAGDDQGRVHLFLNGSVLLGSVQIALAAGEAVVGSQVLPGGPATALAVLLASDSALSLRTLDLALPPALVLLAAQSSRLKSSLEHAMDALQHARVGWDESRRIAKGWLGRLSETSRAQATPQPPVSQLLLLLMTGRASAPLHDFLASKMNERVLSKWETTTASALEDLRKAAFTSVIPAVERVVVLVDELQAWAGWPAKFAPFALAPLVLARAKTTACTILSLASTLEMQALEEERCFSSFAHWLRFELEKVAAQDGSDVRPLARFQPLPVAHYIRHCLPADASTIGPLLNFGLGTAPLESNVELRAAEDWFEGLAGEGDAEGEREGLRGVMRRMKEELKGQADAAKVERARPRAGTTGPLEGDKERPGRRNDRATLAPRAKPTPTSLPVLLHLLAGKLAAALEQAMATVGHSATLREQVQLGHHDPDRRLVRERLISHSGAHHVASISSNRLQLTRRNISGTVEYASASLDQASVIDFDFYDDLDLLFLLQHPPRTVNDGLTYSLSTVPLSHLTFTPTPSPIATPLPITRQHALDPHFPPERLALNGRQGRRVACVLAGDGRRLQVLEVDEEDEGDEDEEDVEMKAA